MASLGNFALILTLVASGWALIVGFTGARSGREQPIRSAEGAMKGAALALTAAGFALFYALVTKDFSIEYVAQYTSKSLSMFYTLGAFWAGQSGSLLLWAWLLGLYSTIVIVRNKTRNRELMPWVTVVLAATTLFFTVLVTFYSNPFAQLAVVPDDGQGLNPLLQNYGQWVHPITLYAGFVGFTVPFAFAIAALVTGRLGDRWIRSVRMWTLWSWVLLTAGILLGARWAYVELGWGGYWAWDPVENASLLPWLTATAYLHSVVVQEKRGMLKVWNVALIVGTFALSIFGTFLTRSGVISSVHAFAESTMGPLLIGFTLLSIVVSTALTVWRLPELRRSGRIGSVVSRESSFLITNLILVAMAVVVLWGTIYPLVAQAVRGVKVSIGPPFFQALMAPLAIALLALAGVCPLLAWRHGEVQRMKRNFMVPLIVGGVALLALLVVTRGRHLGVVLVLGLGAFVMTTIVSELWRGLQARHVNHGEGWLTALHHLFSHTPRRYGGPIVHAGMVVLITGIAINVAFKQEHQTQLTVGQSAKTGAYTVTFRDLTFEQDPVRFALIGTFDVQGADGTTHTITAEQVTFENQQNVTEVGIDASASADLYIVMNNVDPTERIATVLFFVEPGVFWIWLGMVIVVVGGILAAWPWRADRAEREGVLDERELAAADTA